jgi:hypothetical protein
MLGNAPFYYRSIRKAVIAFGSIFNEITLVKYTNDTLQEVSRAIVPLSYERKENFITRLQDNPDLAKPVEITLPRMTFFIESYEYDVTRKLNSYNQQIVPGSSMSTAASQYQSVPWNLGFSLSLYVRNVEDGTQIIEQILPFFTPDYTVTINYVPELGISRNAPLILNGVTCDTEFAGDAKEEERTIIWTLNFVMQANFYGPIATGNVITQTNTNIYINTTLGDLGGAASDVEVFTANTGFGSFSLGEIVYQGANLPDVVSSGGPYGTVSTWDAAGHRLVLSNVKGFFQATANVVGANSYASWGVAGLDDNILMAVVTNTVVPNTANQNSDYGFSTTITEYPETLPQANIFGP